ncbi:tetratricopeptide repeat protein [Fulvivirga lutea]|uniref:Tetratricopeptide repeat protein n=1 Tax=Fulvivirga lutea TaxID=2810512 RepID=A0A974WEM5_9BACT|nr:hypothetical protein [Fulvivirga lutea]QSE95993.1 hypothetical protein JR347_10225 [Fulvivirga lutea]
MICIFLCATSSIKAQFRQADSIANLGNNKLALLEYERIVFRNLSVETTNQALLKKANVLNEEGDHAAALNTLNRANLFVEQNETNLEIRKQIIINAYLIGDYPNALSQLKQTEYFFKDNGYHDILFMHVLVLNEMRRWEEASEKLVEYKQHNPEFELEIVKAYHFLEDTKLKDPKKAETLSYILPGVGQMYAGYFFKGLVSSTIQASLIAFGAYSLYEGYFFTGALTGIGLFYSFYSGGVRHASYLAKKKNEELTRSYNDPIKDSLLEFEMSK